MLQVSDVLRMMMKTLDEITMRIFVRLPLVIAVFSLLCLSVPANLAVVNAGGDATDPALYSNDWRTTGPPGGDVRALVVDPGNPDRYYFGTLDGQIYTSADGGRHWQLLYNFGKPRVFIDNIIVDPRNSRVIYVGGHRHDNPGGFFKSVDGGVTWKESAELKNEALHSLAQSESNPDTLIAGTYNTIFRSDDAGDTWKQLPTAKVPGLHHVESIAIDPRDPNHVIASACSGIYESKNGGENWRKVQGIPSQSRRTRAILQHPSESGVVFAGTTEGFWRSDKGGDADSWMVTTSRQLEINSIAVHPSRPDMVYIGTNNYGVMISNDGGKSFTPTNGGFSGRFAYAILSDRETPNRIYASTINTATGGGFLFVSNDNGENWRPSMRNMPSRLITYAIVQDTRDANFLYLGTNLGVYRSTDRGTSWAPVWAPTDPEKKKTTTKKAAKPSSARARTRSTQASNETV